MTFRHRPRREGKSQWESQERNRNKGRRGCAIMRDGSVVEITGLAHQVELAESGSVRMFSWMDEVQA